MKPWLNSEFLSVLLSMAASATTVPGWPVPPCPAMDGPSEASLGGPDHDASDLLRLAANHDGSTEALLVQAEAASLLLLDEAALDHARRYLGGASPSRARDAWSLIGIVELRRGNYADAARAMETALGLPLVTDDKDQSQADSLQKSLQMARTLAGEPSPQSPNVTEGELAVAADMAGLMRGRMAVNDQSLDAVLDTGAGLSVIVGSLVEPLGLRMLEGDVKIASPVSPATPARLAIAERIRIGGTEHRNVVFLVMPDEALTFAGGAYRIEAILGFPVLSRLGRLQFSSVGVEQVLRFRRAAGQHPGSEVNLVVDGLTPKVLACTGSPPRQLQLALDSGASETSMLARYTRVFPEALTGARPVTETVGGAGGTIEQEALLLAQVVLDLAGRRISLTEIAVSPEALDQPLDHGRLGQDVLKDGYTLDFQTMQFELADGGNSLGQEGPETQGDPAS